MKRLASTITALLFAAAGFASAADKPNVLFIAIDDQNDWIGHLGGHPLAKTPHMDRLAAEGVRFRQAFATVASCNASRAVIYTGVLTHRNGQYAHTPAEHNQRVRPDVTTVFEKLKAHGYRTALVGKQHIAPLEKYPFDLTTTEVPVKKNAASPPTGYRVSTKDVNGLGQACDELICHHESVKLRLCLARMGGSSKPMRRITGCPRRKHSGNL